MIVVIVNSDDLILYSSDSGPASTGAVFGAQPVALNRLFVIPTMSVEPEFTVLYKSLASTRHGVSNF